MTFSNAIVTAYCAGACCCGPTAPRLAANGEWPVIGVTVAGPRNIHLGTWVEITLPGQPKPITRRVDDRTARRFDGRWDLFLATHADAKRFGIHRNATVRILSAQ